MRIREIRRARNITQKELAEYVGIGYTVISKYENGKIVPPLDRLSKIAECLDVSINELLLEHAPTHSSYSRLAGYLIAMNKGCCELCSAPAPFEDEFGIPYLQEYCIDSFTENIEITKNNLVVLCPNCLARISASHDKLEIISQLHRIIQERE